ncbi:MAG: tripartite tricarboxylate transporter substrate binding protein [Betaproteobacteria bacterium]|nr:tripartite tricarboxylate transporter substrate binding protein [Betaproteobacteria bacterium]
MKILAALATAMVIGPVWAGSVWAQAYPNKAVRIIVPFSAGGSFDITSRILAQRMGPALGQNVLVENRPGAGGIVGTEYVSRLPADGYTLLAVGPSFIINPALRAKSPFDPAKDFKAVSQTIAMAMAIAVTSTMPVKSLQELIALARSRPGEIAYGTPGPGTIQHLLGEQFGLVTKAKFVHAPYQGGAPAAVATAGGHSPMLLGNVVLMSPFIKSGKLRLLAVTSPQRDDLVPGVPTMREAGYPALEATNWSGMVIASAVPADIVARLNAEIVRTLNLAEVRDLLKAQAIHATPSTPEEFATLLRTDAARYARIARVANVKVD